MNELEKRIAKLQKSKKFKKSIASLSGWTLSTTKNPADDPNSIAL